MAARGMANFGLGELRLVVPREGWPNEEARAPAVNATAILDDARAFSSTAEAVSDLTWVLATTARSRGQMKRVLSPEAAFTDLARRAAAGQRTGILFGRERTGLENDDISLADAILTYPVDPRFASLNLAGAVLIAAYEWARISATATDSPDPAPRAEPASREAVVGLFDHIESELDATGYYPPDKRSVMTRNMRDMFHRMSMTAQDVSTWRGVIRALGRAARRKG